MFSLFFFPSPFPLFPFSLSVLNSKTKQYPSYADDKKTLSELGIKKDTQIEAKDLGPQFSYRGVFVIEYLGPILIILMYAMRPTFLFGTAAGGGTPIDFVNVLTKTNVSTVKEGSAEWNAYVQSLAIAMWLLHFTKREFET